MVKQKKRKSHAHEQCSKHFDKCNTADRRNVSIKILTLNGSKLIRFPIIKSYIAT